MINYKKLYTGLFNAITTALAHMEEGNWGLAKECLKSAQIYAEEKYLEQ